MTLSFNRRSALGLALLGATPCAFAQGTSEPVLRVVSPFEYASNEPTDIGFILTRMGIAETLVQVEPSGVLVGGVATSWSVDPDRLTWRFAIGRGATFHDGSPVTAETVAASLKLAFRGESLSSVPLDSVSAEGGDVVVRTRTPFSALPSFMVDFAAIVLAPASYGPDGKVVKIVATGPYRLVAVDGKTTLELERFDEHPRLKPAVARVRYTAVTNGETRANIAVAGDADIVFILAPTATARIDAAGQTRVASLTVPRIRPIAFNCGLPQFSDVRVRRAVSLAIDRAGIASAILRHPPSAATQLLPPLMKDWYDPSLPALAYDPDAARRLLDEAGWVSGPDGVRAKDGVRLASRLLALTNRPELPVMATAIQAQLKRVGIEITIETGPTGAIPAAIKDGKMEMTLMGRTYVNVPEVIATIIPDYTLERSVWGTVDWADRGRMKALTDDYVQSFDEGHKRDLRREIIRMIHEEAPVIPIAWYELTAAVSNRIRGVEVDPYEMRYFLERVAWR